MSKISMFRSVTVFLSVLLCLSGCATNKPLSRDDLKPITSMTAAHLKSPPLLKETTGSKVAGAVGMMFGAIGGGIGGAIQYKLMEGNGKALQESCNLPDYNEHIFKQLVQRIPKEVTDWPPMVVKTAPLSDEAEANNGYALLVQVSNIRVADGVGLSTWTTARLRDPQGNILWAKTVKYVTKDLKRECDLDNLEADKGKLLNEEFQFAIENTVSTIIKDLNGDPPKI